MRKIPISQKWSFSIADCSPTGWHMGFYHQYTLIRNEFRNIFFYGNELWSVNWYNIWAQWDVTNQLDMLCFNDVGLFGIRQYSSDTSVSWGTSWQSIGCNGMPNSYTHTHTHKSRSVQLQIALFNCVYMYINVHPTIQPIVTVVGMALSNIEAHDIALAVETFQVVVGGRCLPCDDVGCDWLNQDEEIIKSLWNNNPWPPDHRKLKSAGDFKKKR